MAYLEKLLIKGIRSYNPNDSNTIEFCSPMTLIIGANGTGKTTIIECLKYITTGNLPPNSKGGAFVYDARLAREVDVKAQVKLSFRDNTGQRMVCSRSLQCTQKASKIEQKTLESVVYVEGHKDDPVNVKAEDLSHFFDVSQCMLDSVIFCHQDESTWPVSEPANVKKKFDDVFSSTKYSKALEGLKAAKRNASSNIKLKYQELEYLYKSKEKKNEVERRLSEVSRDLKIKKKKEEGYAGELGTCENLLEEISKDIEKIQAISQKLAKKKEEVRALSLLSEEKMSLEEALRISQDLKSTKLENELKGVRVDFQRSEEELGYLEKEKAEYEKNKKEVDEFQKKISQLENKKLSLVKEVETGKGDLLDQIAKLKERMSQGGPGIDSNVLEEVFGLIFRDFEIQLEIKQTNLEASKKEIDDLKDSLRNHSRRIKEIESFISGCGLEEDDPSVDLEASFVDLINKLGSDRLNLKQEVQDLEKAYFDLQAKFQEELKKSREAYEITQKNLRIESIRKETKDLSKASLELYAEKCLSKIRRIKEEIKEAHENKNKIKIYQSMYREKQEKGQEEIANKVRSLESRNKKIQKMKKDLKDEDPDVEKSLAEARKASEAIGGAKVIYENLLKVGMKKGECPLCLSKINLEIFRNRIEKIISKIPENNTNKVRRLEELYKLVQAYNQEVEESKKAEEDLKKYKSDLETELKDIKSREEGLVDHNLEDLEMTLLDYEEDLAEVERKIKLLSELEILSRDTRGFVPVNIAGIEEELNLAKEDLTNKKKVLCGIEAKIVELENKQIHFEKVKTNREKLERVRLMEKEKEEISLRLSTGNKSLEEKDLLYKKKIRNFQVAKENFLKKKVQIEHKLESLNLKEKDLKNVLEEMSLHKQRCILKDFNDREYHRLREYVFMQKSRINEIQEELHKERERQEEAKSHILHFENKERREVLKKEIKKILSLFPSNGQDPTAFLNTHLEKKKSLEEKKSEILQKKSLTQGEINQLAVMKRDICRELEKEYKTVVEDYNKAYVEHKVLELSLKDLDKFINVLDKAILDFHSYKIEEVNKILKDLWVSCYKGNDIDYIELKSESLSNKTYSYRISQIKNGIELEMRGRCSAGQKMLASILVRLALAQTFGASFNVLALDEPTTNLDRENIESLAGALVRIIQNSPQESKFQLIVITHDEDFVNLLSRESSEHFYRLTRNERGDSQIHRHTIY